MIRLTVYLIFRSGLRKQFYILPVAQTLITVDWSKILA